MSLRAFIQAATKEVQEALARKAAQTEQRSTDQPAPATKEVAEEAEEEEPSLRHRKSKRKGREETEQDVVGRQRKKERARKAEHEPCRPSSEAENEKQKNEEIMEKSEVPMTPSIEVSQEQMEAEETGEPSEQPGEDDGQHPYVPAWNIYPGTQLRLPLERAEWVAGALPPAEMAVFAGAKMFDICDMANRAAVMATVSANSMQQLLVAQDKQVKNWKAEVTALRLSKSRAERLTEEAVRREQEANRDRNTLSVQAGRVPELENELMRAKNEAEEAQKQVAAMEELKAQLAQKEKEIEEMQAKNAVLTQDVEGTKEKLAWSEETRRFLMTSGIAEIVAKCRASHELGKLVGQLTREIQVMGKNDLVRELHPVYFPSAKIEDVPGYCEEAESRAEAAFQMLQHEPISFQVLADLAARPDMTREEISRLENPDLLSGRE